MQQLTVPDKESGTIIRCVPNDFREIVLICRGFALHHITIAVYYRNIRKGKNFLSDFDSSTNSILVFRIKTTVQSFIKFHSKSRLLER